MAEGNRRGIHLNKACLGGQCEGFGEGSFCNMDFGFHDEEKGAGVERSAHLLEKLGLSGNFMQHVAGQCEVNSGRHSFRIVYEPALFPCLETAPKNLS